MKHTAQLFLVDALCQTDVEPDKKPLLVSLAVSKS